MYVIKRDGRKVLFDKSKIEIAISRAMHQGSGIIKEKIANDIANEIENEFSGLEEINISIVKILIN